MVLPCFSPAACQGWAHGLDFPVLTRQDVRWVLIEAASPQGAFLSGMLTPCWFKRGASSGSH